MFLKIIRFIAITLLIAAGLLLLFRQDLWTAPASKPAATPTAVPTIALPTPTVPGAFSVTLPSTDKLPSVQLKVTRSATGYIVTDAEGDSFRCSWVPVTQADMGKCAYVAR